MHLVPCDVKIILNLQTPFIIYAFGFIVWKKLGLRTKNAKNAKLSWFRLRWLGCKTSFLKSINSIFRHPYKFEIFFLALTVVHATFQRFEISLKFCVSDSLTSNGNCFTSRSFFTWVRYVLIGLIFMYYSTVYSSLLHLASLIVHSFGGWRI
jgi:hypothetical protein